MGSSMVIKNGSELRSNLGGRQDKDAWLAGGNWDFHALFRDHARELTHFLQRNGHDRETSRDLLQDTFVRVISKTPKKKATGHNPRAYLFKVSRNLGINLKIRQNRVPMVSLDASLMDTLVDPQPDCGTDNTISSDANPDTEGNGMRCRSAVAAPLRCTVSASVPLLRSRTR